MPKLVNKPPKLRHHASGQGIVTYRNRDHYLGAWKKGTRAPKVVLENFRRFVAEEWQSEVHLPDAEQNKVTIVECCSAYWAYAKKLYTKNGRPTSEVASVKSALRSLKQLYGSIPAVEFGPLKLQALRNHIAQTEDLTRGVLNKKLGRIKRMLKWAKNNEIIPASVYDNIRDVEGLRKGEAHLREPEPVQPVPDAVVQQTLACLSETVGDMVRLQRLCGARPGEICILRPIDVDRSGAVWLYRPESHKTQHHGRDRVICIGPKGQDVLRKYLLRPDESYCFVPSEAMEKRWPTSSRRVQGKRFRYVNSHYDTHSYYAAVRRACVAAGVKAWSPGRLRHSAATQIRKEFGLEAAQTALGHTRADVSQIYAQRDLSLAVHVAEKIG